MQEKELLFVSLAKKAVAFAGFYTKTVAFVPEIW